MAKTVSQIRNEISSFYLAIQDEITDVSTGSVAGGLIYSLANALSQLYQDLDELESQAYIATASGTYLDLLIEGGFDLSRLGASRSTGYVLIYGDNPISDPDTLETELICADYDYDNNAFLSGLNAATKFNGVNLSGSSQVSYALIKPRNRAFYKRDSDNRIILDLKGKQAQYFLLPVASILKGSQVNIKESSLKTFTAPPPGLAYVRNINNPGSIIFDYSGVSSAPLYSRVTTSLEYLSQQFRVINAFNFSSQGFLEVSYRASSPTRLARGVYTSPSGTQISGGIVFRYGSKTQTSINIGESGKSLIRRYENNDLIQYDLSSFSYNGITYNVDQNDKWTSDQLVIEGSDVVIGPSNPINGSNVFFSTFFGEDDWVLQQKREQVSEDIIFDPDEVLTESYAIKEEYRLSQARDQMSDSEYRAYFQNYINSLPRGTKSALEFAALQVPGVAFAKTVPQSESPLGSAVLLASADSGQLSPTLKQSILNYLQDDWASAGVNLIISPPDLISVSIAVSIELTDNSLSNFVKNSVESSVAAYLTSKVPEDDIRYSDIYGLISGIAGVKSVSNLIIGKTSDDHYVDFRENYAKVMFTRLVEYNDEYSLDSEEAFEDVRNEIPISSSLSGVDITPMKFSEFSTYLPAENIFSIYNILASDVSPSSEEVYFENLGYGAVAGLFSSDAGGDISTSSYSTTLYSNDFTSLSADNVFNLSFLTATDSVVTLNINGNTYVSSDITERRTVNATLPTTSSDVTVVFSSDGSSSVNGIQAFLHEDSIESYFVAHITDLDSWGIIDDDKVNFIYDMEQTSNRFIDLKFINATADEDTTLRSIYGAVLAAQSLFVYQSILKDYQYSQNSSGLNSGFAGGLFADTSQSDAPFKHFLVYAGISPFSPNLEAVYPLSPDGTRYQDVDDYTLTFREITRIGSIPVRPSSTTLVPTVGLEFE